MREIVAKQPQDPVDYLTRWLLNYPSCQEMLERRRQDAEKLTSLRSQLQNLQSAEVSINPIYYMYNVLYRYHMSGHYGEYEIELSPVMTRCFQKYL